jgi:hypothetical protein
VDKKGQASITEYRNDVTSDGVIDMAGNVSEWVFDLYDGFIYRNQATNNPLNPTGATAGTNRVVRGGNYAYVPLFARVVHRQDFDPLTANPTIGFRCAITGGTLAPAGSNNTGTTDSTGTTNSNVVATPVGSLSSGVK